MAPLPISTYAPWGNAQLTFEVSDGVITTDPATGNPVTGVTALEYLASLNISGPDWQSQEGSDMTTYRCTGRLLHPTTFDPRITNGSSAQAVINGYTGRFELTFDLAMDSDAYPVVRQSVQGNFRVIGGKQLSSPLPPPPEGD